MAKPDDQACSQFLDEGPCKSPEDVTIAGIKIGMDTYTALDTNRDSL